MEINKSDNLTILFLCGRELSYTRNNVLYNALSNRGKVKDISSSHKNYLIRHLIVIYRFLISRRDYDVVFVGFYGQLLVPVVRLFTRKPIIFDAFISTYQTLCFDRKKFSPRSPVGKLAFYLDKYSCNKSNKILLDTNAHIDYFVNTFGIDKNKFLRIFVGADEELFYPRPAVKNKKPIVFTYSAYQPLHGTEYIVEAAKILENKANFIIVGKGIERKKIDNLVAKLKPKNITFIDWVPYKKLPEYISKSDVCLGGHFGNTQKAKMVIAGKTFQFIAMKKPTILTINMANLELFSQQEGMFCEQADEKSLAKKINELITDRKKALTVTNIEHRRFNDEASYTKTTSKMSKLLKEFAT
jgi:glycosyltransferase involved in cell wall biosynthesis